MRIISVLAFLLGSVAAAAAQPAPTAAPAAALGPLQTYDVPTTGRPQTVYIMTRVFKPNENAGKHTHSGVEITQVLYGTIRLEVRGSKPRIFHAGGSFIIPRGAVHDARNIGTTNAGLAVTYVLDKGAPLHNPVP